MGDNQVHKASYYGYGGGKALSDIGSPNSNLQINDQSPTFYFYFENNANPMANNWWFATATSPNEFALVRLITKKNSREFEVGSSSSIGGYGGSHSGIPEIQNPDKLYGSF